MFGGNRIALLVSLWLFLVVQKLTQQARLKQKRFGDLLQPRLLVESCETPYGFAAITCSPIGVRKIHLFYHKRQLDHYMQQHTPTNPAASQPVSAAHRALIERVRGAVSGHLSFEDLPLDLSGTAFQLRVWRYLRSIPSGEVRSYSEVATALAVSSAVRAVANACGRNVVALAVPCHRVIRADRSLGGYRWGVGLKQELLLLERQARAESACF
jgi:AraC family transcriptional regulator of adaptative response/methylated-DNA-[protein]-cysteine methyltransferase